jgi:Winged helix-turn helix
MAISLPDARQLSDEVLEALRLRALRGCELGFTGADVADLLGVSRETVSRGWTAYAAGGLGALPSDRTGRPVGSGRTLSEEQARHIPAADRRPWPRGTGHRRRAVDPQDGARPDPQ